MTTKYENMNFLSKVDYLNNLTFEKNLKNLNLKIPWIKWVPNILDVSRAVSANILLHPFDSRNLFPIERQQQ